MKSVASHVHIVRNSSLHKCEASLDFEGFFQYFYSCVCCNILPYYLIKFLETLYHVLEYYWCIMFSLFRIFFLVIILHTFLQVIHKMILVKGLSCSQIIGVLIKQSNVVWLELRQISTRDQMTQKFTSIGHRTVFNYEQSPYHIVELTIHIRWNRFNLSDVNK